jgi:hypothetical protein
MLVRHGIDPRRMHLLPRRDRLVCQATDESDSSGGNSGGSRGSGLPALDQRRTVDLSCRTNGEDSAQGAYNRTRRTVRSHKNNR